MVLVNLQSKNKQNAGHLMVFIAVVLFWTLTIPTAKANVLRQKSYAKRISFQTLRPDHSNGDYLNGVERPKYKDQNINTFLFNGAAGKQMQNDYLSIEQKNEMRRNYGLNSMSDQMRFNEENKIIMKNSLNKIVKSQLRDSVRDSFTGSYQRDRQAEKSRKKRALELAKQNSEKSLIAATEKSGSVSAIQKSTAAAVSEEDDIDAEDVLNFIYRAQTGTNVALSDSTEAELHTDTLRGNYKLGVNTDLVDSDVNYRANPIDPLSRDRLSEREERVSFGVSRSIRPVGASTFSRYGLLHKNLSYGLNKEIVEHLNANITRNESFQSREQSETVYGVNFSLNF